MRPSAHTWPDGPADMMLLPKFSGLAAKPVVAAKAATNRTERIFGQENGVMFGMGLR